MDHGSVNEIPVTVGVVGTAVGGGNGSVAVIVGDGSDGPTTFVSMSKAATTSPGLHAVVAVSEVAGTVTTTGAPPLTVNVTALLRSWSPDTAGESAAIAVLIFLPLRT